MAGLVGLIAAGGVMVIGWLLPVEHVARTRATIAAPRSEVWRALTDVSAARAAPASGIPAGLR